MSIIASNLYLRNAFYELTSDGSVECRCFTSPKFELGVSGGSSEFLVRVFVCQYSRTVSRRNPSWFIWSEYALSCACDRLLKVDASCLAIPSRLWPSFAAARENRMRLVETMRTQVSAYDTLY